MNTFPTTPSTRRLAIVSETGHGGSGYLSDSLLASAGIDRSTCFFGYVSPRPGLKFDSAEVQASLVQLKADLLQFKPHFILILDRFGFALRTLAGEKRSVDNWRGSLFISNWIGEPVKCLCTYHPSRLQVEYGLTGVARFDYQKAARELKTDNLVLPVRNIRVLLPD
jgi:uracil-DNA glycosylase family 4